MSTVHIWWPHQPAAAAGAIHHSLAPGAKFSRFTTVFFRFWAAVIVFIAGNGFLGRLFSPAVNEDLERTQQSQQQPTAASASFSGVVFVERRAKQHPPKGFPESFKCFVTQKLTLLFHREKNSILN